jgi:hypothetical protein
MHDDRAAEGVVLGTLFFLRRYRCSTQCGWKGIRLSRSRYRRSKKKLRFALVVLFFAIAAAMTVRYMLPRVGTDGNHDEDVQEGG